MDNIRKIAVMTSGGDAPGMNPTIRAVVRTARSAGIEITGIRRGYEGLLHGDFIDLSKTGVSNILNRGGTFLKTARCKEMYTPEGRDKAAMICKVLGFDALIIIGGDGSLKGGLELYERGINIIGIPGTIDLDFPASDYTIGFDTAVNTAMDGIMKLKDTSESHERCSIIEVMGRNSGYIALWCGIVSGAEEVLIPENEYCTKEDIIRLVIKNRSKGKRHNIIVIAEGVGGTTEIATEVEKVTGIETRATILGHIQRGGMPSALDKLHASCMGYEAVQALLRGEESRVVVYKDGKYGTVDINEAIATNDDGKWSNYYYKIAKTLSV
ncbi:MAG: ATP-dependent 6-phosphofructokinase [Lachnospirales bacterium]